MVWAEKEKIRQGVSTMVKVNLAVQDGEKVLVMTDPPTSEQWSLLELDRLMPALERCILARLVAQLVAELVPGSEVTLFAYPATERSGAEPDAGTAQRMRDWDVIIAITNHSLSNTIAAQQARAAGSRIASMPLFRAAMFEGPMTADYASIAVESAKMADLLSEATTAAIKTPLGTDLTLHLGGRQGGVDSGLITTRGAISNLPGGEAYIAPLEGEADGRIVIPPEGYTRLERQMTIRFSAGLVIGIEGGGRVGEELRELLELPAPGRQSARRNLAELGVGTNPKARSTDTILEAEKIKGTVHIAIGDNSHLGGAVIADMHEDFILWQPDLYLDGRLVIERGKWLV